ncbi:MAG: hypothetical protein AAGJ70_01690 [Pseudomonadota bacterium]
MWTGVFLTGLSTGATVMSYVSDRESSTLNRKMHEAQIRQNELASAQVAWLEKLADELARTGKLSKMPPVRRLRPRRVVVDPVTSLKVDPFQRDR